MYVVAAGAEQPGLSRAPGIPRRSSVPGAQPVGTQHAAAHVIGAAPPPLALCGADLTGWTLFTDRRFDPGCTASCQPCARLVSDAMRPHRTGIGSADESDHSRPSTLGQLVRSRSVGSVVILDAADGHLSDVVGELDRATRVALAAEPRGVVCDLSRVDAVRAPGALRGLALNGRHPRAWPGVPLAVAGLGQGGGEALSLKPLGCHLMVTASLRQALSMVLQASLPSVRTLRLTPHPTAPRASRDFVSRALLDWRLSRRIPAGCLVVSELVTNAIIHAGTDIDLTVAEHRRAIRIAVRDHGADLPVERHQASAEHGRGLAIVTGLATRWGVLPHAEGGKVVWAVIDASPRQSR